MRVIRPTGGPTRIQLTSTPQGFYVSLFAGIGRLNPTWDYQSGGFNSGIHRSRNTRRATGLSKTQLRVPARSH